MTTTMRPRAVKARLLRIQRRPIPVRAELVTSLRLRAAAAVKVTP